MTDDVTPPAGADDTPPVETPPVETPPVETPPAGDTPPADGTVLTDDKDSQGAPEEYADFTLPEGMEMNQALLDAAQPLFKESGLSQIQAQKFIDMHSAQVQADSKASSDSYNQTVKDWVEEGKNDAEYGGDKYDENVGLANRAVDKFGTPKLVEVLKQTGLGNHPEFVRLFTRIGKLIKEDDPGGNETPPGSDKTAAEILYPNEKPKAE